MVAVDAKKHHYTIELSIATQSRDWIATGESSVVVGNDLGQDKVILHLSYFFLRHLSSVRMKQALLK